MSDLVPQLDRLKAQLLTSGISQKNQPLFQVINQLIDAVRQGFGDITGATGISGGGSGGLSNTLSFITSGYEAAPLPNSKQILEGNYIHFDDSVPNKRTITGESWDVLTTGDFDPTYSDIVYAYPDPVSEVIFAGGEVVMVHLPG